MKKAVVTRADSGISVYTEKTHPIIRKYAEDWEADFIILSHRPFVMTDDNKPHYRIMQVYNLFDEYDRIICLDSDMVITKTCPNLFDVIPEDRIGSIYEDVGSRKSERRKLIRKIQMEWGDVGWEKGYTNAGTFVVSKRHKDIFTPVNGKYWLGWGSADVHLSYQIHKLRFEVFELPYIFNHMTMFSEAWNDSPDRFNSHIIHYAGGGIFDLKYKTRIDQIEGDIRDIYGEEGI